jgi:hypothetical protein
MDTILAVVKKIHESLHEHGTMPPTMGFRNRTSCLRSPGPSRGTEVDRVQYTPDGLAAAPQQTQAARLEANRKLRCRSYRAAVTPGSSQPSRSTHGSGSGVNSPVTQLHRPECRRS